MGDESGNSLFMAPTPGLETASTTLDEKLEYGSNFGLPLEE
jgi:hypothetical protein